MIGEIKKFLRDDGIIRISRSVKELGIKIKELDRIYIAKTGESLCVSRLSKILELPEENIYIAMEASQTVESILGLGTKVTMNKKIKRNKELENNTY